MPWPSSIRSTGSALRGSTAVRAGLSVAVPLLVLWALGLAEWSLYATFRCVRVGLRPGEGRAARLRIRAVLGLVLIAAVTSGAVVALSADRSWIAVARHYGAALIAITPLALLLGHLADPRPIGELLADRAVETLIGVAVGLLVAVATLDRSASSA